MNLVITSIINRLLLLAMLCIFPLSGFAQKITLSAKEAAEIGNKVWQNECGGTITGLTSWNAGENFASMGIGHFIWYPMGVEGPFDESFPKLLQFIKSREIKFPGWLKPEMDCPWNSLEDFKKNSQSKKMLELREMLAKTVREQTEFLVLRLEKSLPKMVDAAAQSQRESISKQFYRVAESSNGKYALIDYVNFKGEGILETERYKGEGWGLLQVLENMKVDATDATQEFANSAKKTLTRRVHNSPSERKEERWLPGWKKRVEGYAG